MDVIMLILMIPCVLWMLTQIILGFRDARRTVAEMDVEVSVRCEECGSEYKASIRELTMTSVFNKDVHSVSVQTPAGGATLPTAMKKKCYCPKCGKIVWASIQDPQPLAINSGALAVPVLLKHFILGVMPFALLILISELLGI